MEIQNQSIINFQNILNAENPRRFKTYKKDLTQNHAGMTRIKEFSRKECQEGAKIAVLKSFNDELAPNK